MTVQKLNKFYKDTEIHSIEKLISCYGSNEFHSPLRSTIPLIQLVFHNLETLKQIIPDIESSTCVFEYETPVQKGKGNPSCTDLMIKNNRTAYFIEAKRTEHKYENVGKWLHHGKSENSYTNRMLVLNGWLDIINGRCSKSIRIDDVLDFSYQMIHRFASACQTTGPSEMDYFVFKSDQDTDNHKEYIEELQRLSRLCCDAVPIKLVLFNIFSDHNYQTIEQDYKNEKIDYSSTIKQMLVEDKVFTVSLNKVITIS